MSNERNDSKLISLGGLCINEKKDKTKYMSGNLNSRVKILIFPNKNKKTDKHPDYNMFLAPIEKPPEERQSDAGSQPPPPDDGPL